MVALLKMRAQKNMTRNFLKTRKVATTDHAMTDQKKGRKSILQARTAKKRDKRVRKKGKKKGKADKSKKKEKKSTQNIW